MSFDPIRYVEQLRAVGEPNRLRVLLLLMHGELAVGELAQIMGQSQPRLSHHLKALTSAGLVERLPEGSWVFYCVPAIGPVRDFLDQIVAPIDASEGDFGRDAQQLAKIRGARTQTAAAYFSEMADTWDTVRGLHYPNEAIERAMLEMAGKGPFKRVVDIGTGTGRMLSLFADNANRLDGIDLSHRMLTVARANLDRDGVTHAHVRQGDAGALPYETGSADLIIIHQVLHFIDEPDRILAEAARILMPGGKLLVADFAPHTLEFLRDKHGHRRLGVRRDAMMDWCQKAGLKITCSRAFEPPEELAEGLGVLLWSGQHQMVKPALDKEVAE